ncbi:MAG: pyridoxamine 5'-phosphate oxidase family protein [Aliiglaciecola sp.]|uniref:pyridoxamine 5'-phosphate oxidase family protein n=1 Tax=Aliiglaciecola sp. TaxID=1872441 RepID=UPI0032990D1F
MNNNKSATSWLQTLQGSLNENQALPEAKYLQLATINSENHPEVRTVVFRGFVDSSASLLIHTDIRSQKIQHIWAHNQAQICWYFSQSREQYRLTGKVKVVTANSDLQQSLRLQHWQNLSVSAKHSYYWDTPGEVLGLDDEFQGRVDENKHTEQISDNFCLLVFSVLAVDHLQLKPTPHKRSRYVYSDDSWQTIKVNP